MKCDRLGYIIINTKTKYNGLMNINNGKNKSNNNLKNK